jgi:DNA-binding LytR/AlgR family response regulator
MIQAIAFDDEPKALEVIEQFCERLSFLELKGTFTQASLVKKHLAKFPVDLIFLDIQMPDVHGVEFARQLPKNVMVIFTTAHREFAVEGFELEVLDYLLKPFRFARFEAACLKAKEHYDFQRRKEAPEINYLMVRAEYSLVKIPFQDILYLETMDDYIRIHQLGKKPVLTLMSMKKMMEKLPEDQFVRIHRSFVIPLFRIETVRNRSVSLGVLELPIGSSYEKEFYLRYMKDSF